jgi:hypothetical protein
MLLTLRMTYVTQFMLRADIFSDEMGSCRRNGQGSVLLYTRNATFLEQQIDQNKRQTRRRTSVWVLYIRNKNYINYNISHHLADRSHYFHTNIRLIFGQPRLKTSLAIKIVYYVKKQK